MLQEYEEPGATKPGRNFYQTQTKYNSSTDEPNSERNRG